MKLTLNSLLGVLLTLCMFSCSEDELTSDNPIETPISGGVISPPTNVQRIENEAIANVVTTNELNASVLINVTDADGIAISGASVTIANQTNTSANGVVVFNDIHFNTDFVGIKIAHPNYITAFKNFTPTETVVYNFEFTLFEGQHENIIAAEGAELSFDSGITLDFEPNSFVTAEGTAFEGEVTVNTYYHTEDNPNYLAAQPGALVGLDGEELTALATEGMLTVDLTDAAGNEVFIAEGQSVQVTMPAAADAPATIDLWHLNETYGIWVKTGTATKVGEVYGFSVTHFSCYNLDVFINSVSRVSCVVRSSASQIIANTRCQLLIDGVPIRIVTTDSNGRCSLRYAPVGAYVLQPIVCGVEVSSVDIQVEATGIYEFDVPEYNEFYEQNTLRCSGTVISCEETAVFDSSVWLQANVFSALANINGQGEFSVDITLCDPLDLEALLVELSLSEDIILEAVQFIRDNTTLNTFVAENILLCEEESTEEPVEETEDEFITIEDEALLAYILEELEIEENQRITVQQSEAVEQLGFIRDNSGFNLINLNVADLVDNFPNLQRLYLNCENYSNFNRITELTQLTELTCANLVETTVLNNLSNLLRLTIFNCNFPNVSSIQNLINLEYLYIHSTDLSDLSGLENMLNLETLFVPSNRITDISVLSNLVNLQFFECSNNTITDLSPVSNLPNLVSITARINDISDISMLSNFNRLELLSLEQNNISDISPVSNLLNLNILELGRNNISDISPLSSLTGLRFLDLDRNNISDVSVLANLNELQHLKVDNNRITNLAPLSNLVNLRLLGTRSNDISELTPLNNLNNLRFLYLAGNTRLTEAQVNELRERLPEADIQF